MNVLMIGLDSTLAMDKDKIAGDAQHRHILYGRYLSNLFIIVHSKQEQKCSVKRLSDKVIVYPTSSERFVFSFIWDAYKIGKRICRENKIDVLVTQDPLFTGLIGYLLKKKYKIPIEMHLHGDYLDNKYWLKEGKMNFFLNKLGKWLVRRANGIRVLNSEIKNRLINYGVSEDKIWVISTPVFLKKFKDFSYSEVTEVRKRYLLDNGSIVLFVGRLAKQKNIPNLIKAAQIVVDKYPETTFLICGDGSERKDLENLSEKSGLKNNIFFLGNIPYVKLPNYYFACDLVVLPSNYEGLPKVPIEAAMAKKPIVSTNVSGSSDIIVDNVTGFLCPLGDHKVFAEKVIELIEKPEFAETMGENSQKHILGIFNPEKNIKKIVTMWEKTIELAK